MTTRVRSMEPVYISGGPSACLVLHGFGGSPAELRPVIAHLADQGFTVSAPVLPGHGAAAEALGTTRFRHWLRAAESALAQLQRRPSPAGGCGPGQRTTAVHLVGFSMGGLIALYLAARHEVASVTTLAVPTLLRDWRQLQQPLSRYLPPERQPQLTMRSLARLARLVRRDLPRVQAPVQALQGDCDAWIDPASAAYLITHVASEEKQTRLLSGRGHFLALERGRDEVAQLTADWIVAHSDCPHSPGARGPTIPKAYT